MHDGEFFLGLILVDESAVDPNVSYLAIIEPYYFSGSSSFYLFGLELFDPS